MSYYATDGSGAVEHLDLKVGQRIKLRDGGPRWWTVQAVSEHFAACVQQVPFQPKGVLQYTVLDWRNGVRGPCDLVGQGYGDGSYTPAECAEMLADFEGVPGGHRRPEWPLAVSQRNWVRLVVMDGPSPRGAWGHAIAGRLAGRGFDQEFDPHPSGAGLTEVTELFLIRPAVFPLRPRLAIGAAA